MNLTEFYWAKAAAAALGIGDTTLRRRAAKGTVATRTNDETGFTEFWCEGSKEVK